MILSGWVLGASFQKAYKFAVCLYESMPHQNAIQDAFDQLSFENYRRYYGEGTSRVSMRQIGVCNYAWCTYVLSEPNSNQG